jgi:predicted SnoaL-like aldol condensation-catalyzing enzyme/truncated hemoglobin YjbI
MKVVLFITLVTLAGIGAQCQTNKTQKKKMTNTEIAKAVNTAVMAGNIEAGTALVTENYVQHTPNVPSGKAGLAVLLTKIKNKEIPAPQIKTVRTLIDGDFVILHHDVMWPNRKAMFEIFRMENGLAAEHWSAIADHPETTANGHTMLDGATEITDIQNTEKNKAFVRSFVDTVLIAGNFDKLPDYYAADIIQHNPYIDNTIPGLISGIQNLQSQGITLQIQKIWKVFGQGNFVLVCSEGFFAGKPTAFFDLFRTEGGKIVEHWDVLQEIPEKAAHNNGFYQPALYTRLGGYDGIAAYVDHAFPQVAGHPDLQHLFIGHATATKMKQRQLIIDKLVSTLQGPTIYLGQPLEKVHNGLNITAAQWGTFIGIMSKAMDELGITGSTKTDFLHLFETFRQVTVQTEIR